MTPEERAALKAQVLANPDGPMNLREILVAADVMFRECIVPQRYIGGMGSSHRDYSLLGAPSGWTMKSDSFDELADGRDFVYLSAGRYIDGWVSVAARDKIKAAGITSARGSKIKFSPPSHPCGESTGGYGRGEASYTCPRPCEPGGSKCARHAGHDRRREAESAAFRQTLADASREISRREEATRRSNELLAEAAPLFEALGIVPDTVTVTEHGNVEMPSETLDRILRLAAEMAEMQAMTEGTSL